MIARRGTFGAKKKAKSAFTVFLVLCPPIRAKTDNGIKIKKNSFVNLTPPASDATEHVRSCA